jgi:hypothetical protein
VVVIMGWVEGRGVGLFTVSVGEAVDVMSKVDNGATGTIEKESGFVKGDSTIWPPVLQPARAILRNTAPSTHRHLTAELAFFIQYSTFIIDNHSKLVQ